MLIRRIPVHSGEEALREVDLSNAPEEDARQRCMVVILYEMDEV